MAVHINRDLEPAGYWQEVGELAGELLAASPLRSWTVTVRRRASLGAAGAARWASHIDYGAKTFDVAVPADADDADEASPEDAATRVVLDLLFESVSEVEDHLLTLRPPAEALAASGHPLAPPPAIPDGGDAATWAR